MTEKEKTNKHILEELYERYGTKDPSGFSDYTQKTQRYDKMPDNQFGHAWNLINIKQGDVKEYDDLLHPHLFLGAIDDFKTLKLYQDVSDYIDSIFSLAQHDEAMKTVFNNVFYSFIKDVRLTGTLDGSERIYQAFKIPSKRKSGFKLFKGRKKKREPMDYVFPDEEDEGLY